MPEIKHNFTGGRMNKDLDERLIKNGEYRDATNIQVITTDGGEDGIGNAGTVQNLKGNRKVGESYFNDGWMSTSKPKCIASVADEKNDKAYFLFASPLKGPNFSLAFSSEEFSKRVYIDTILEQDIDGTTTPVVVDNFAIVEKITSVLGNDYANDPTLYQDPWSEITVSDASQYRVDMVIRVLNTSGEEMVGGGVSTIKIKAIDGNTLLLYEDVKLDLINSPAAWFVFEAERVLNFSNGNILDDSFTDDSYTYITGINIIDNLLFWTDNYSEPKKINIDRCKAGTSTITSHTKLFIEHPVDGDLVDVASTDYDLDTGSLAVDENEFLVDENGNTIIDSYGNNDPTSTEYNENFGNPMPNPNFGVPLQNGSGISSDLKERHITVIRKSPRTAPTLEMSDGVRPNTTINLNNYTFVDVVGSDGQISLGESYSITDTIFESTDFRKDDIIEILEAVSGESVIGGLKMRAKFIAYEFNDGESVIETLYPTDTIKIKIITTAQATSENNNWIIKLELDKKPLFELKLVRFGYRYKYTDGEYSTFSPWSEVAFIPGDFNYTASTGYNLGMVNTIRELVVKDFIPYRIPLDVVAVDVLYKTTDSPNVYVVDTIEKEKSPEWELFTPDGGGETYEIKTGSLSITSEMIHRVLSAEQLLRSWDNVPRFAKAQEIIGNRLLYGNYTQGYNIKENINLTQEIISSDTASVSNPQKSIKSLRDYKIGVVFGDKYGRETPVLTSGYTIKDNSEDGATSLTGDIVVPKSLCALQNKLIVSQIWGDPDTYQVPPVLNNDGWIDYVKYYIKETSSEYYNLIMDRWYYAGDGADENASSIWLSFNSADRNKVDEDTYLILKNKHGSEEPILEKARYKILAIENEAPDYIKTDLVDIGAIKELTPEETGGDDAQNNPVYHGTMWASSGDIVHTTAPQYLWENNFMEISKEFWDASGVGNADSELGVFGREVKGKIQIRIVGACVQAGVLTGRMSSEWRTLTNYVVYENQVTQTDVVRITWDKLFKEEDVNMFNRFVNATLIDPNSFVLGEDSSDDGLQYWIEFREAVVENSPEFDGKFFVKIQRDLATDQNIQTLADAEYVPLQTYQLSYISSHYENQSDMDTDITGISMQQDFFDVNNPWYGGMFDNWIDTTDANFDMLNDAGLVNPYFQFASKHTTHHYHTLNDFQYTNSFISTADSTGDCEDPLFEGEYQLFGDDCVYPGLPHFGQLIGTTELPLGLSNIWEERRMSPFGSSSANYNAMTKNFWDAYDDGSLYQDENGANIDTYQRVFIDSVNMAFMNIIAGPDRDLLNTEGLPDLGGPDGSMLVTDQSDPSFGLQEEEFTYSTNRENGHYGKPINTIYKGEGRIPGQAGEGGATNGTMGSMCLSWIGRHYDSEPNFFTHMKTRGTIFEFVDYPGVKFKVLGVLYQSDGTTQKNWRYPGDDMITTTVADSPEFTDINYFEQSSSDNPVPNTRYTAWVEFRQVDENNQMTTLGLDTSTFDPRGYLHHDGRDSIGVQIYALATTNFENVEAFSEKGACWETEPKEDVDLDIYYEASSALPMVLNKQNAYDFIPIGSKVSGSRTSNFGDTNITPLWRGSIDHRVGNIFFTHPATEHAIVSLIRSNNQYVSQVGETGEIEIIEGPNFGDTELHRRDFTINDKLHFRHKDGLITTAVIREMYKPIDPIEFTQINNDDLQYGVVSGPKAFETAGTTTLSGVNANSQGFDSSGNYLWTFSYVTNSPTNQPEIGDVVMSIATLGDGSPEAYSEYVCGTNNSDELPLIPCGIQIVNLTVSGDNTIISFGGLPPNWNWSQIITLESIAGTDCEFVFQKNYGYYGVDINVWDQPVQLSWHNCYTFGNGVESDRIRDDFNAPQLDNGVKVSTTFSGYREETLSSGLIYSGLYNSTSQINATNEFNMSQKVTKELNPRHGTIQRLKSRDTDVVVFAEDKILKVLSNKDALFNADGNPQLTATDKVLGQTIPFVGDYGISRNPESLTWDQYRMYFTDRQRGAVLRLSQDGLTPISDVGMKTWFRDWLRKSNFLLGTFDTVTGEYNLTIKTPTSANNKTVSFNEASKGWVSFKSFIPSSGLSFSGNYFTVNDYRIWEHNVSSTTSGSIVYRNQFYGDSPVNSKVEVVFNDLPSSVKTFRSVSYEGSQAKIEKFTSTTGGNEYTGNILYAEDSSGVLQPFSSETLPFNQTDNEYYNLVGKDGWYVPHMKTDLQNGSVPEFIKKEGKWFNRIFGKQEDIPNLDTAEFTIQGIGMASDVQQYNIQENDNSDDCTDENGVVVDCDSEDCVYNCNETIVVIEGCMDEAALNYNADAESDNGSCIYTVFGCTDPNSYNYNELATDDDGSCVDPSLTGCVDPNADNYNGAIYSGNFIYDTDNVTIVGFTPCDTYSDFGELNCGCVYTSAEDECQANEGFSWDPVTETCVEDPCECPDGTFHTVCCNVEEDDLCPEGETFVDGNCLTNNFYCNDSNADYYYSGVYDFDPPADFEGTVTEYNGGYLTGGFYNIPCSDADGDGYPDCCTYTPLTIYGCIDPLACNHNPDATDNYDESTNTSYTCDYSCYTCWDENAINYNTDSLGACTDEDGDGLPDCCEYEEVEIIESGEVGCMNPNACNYNPLATNWCNSNEFLGVGSIEGNLPGDGNCCDFCSCGSVGAWCADDYGYSWPPNAIGVNIFPPQFCQDVDDGIIDPVTFNGYGLVQATCEYVGCMNPEADNYCGECDTSIWGEISIGSSCDDNPSGIDLNNCTEFPYSGCCGNGCEGFNFGCTDATACNWDSDANIDNGNCDYSCVGCTDSEATNYCEDCTIDDGSCEFDVYGCTQPGSVNWNYWATIDDGSCIQWELGCMDPNACNYIGASDVANGIYRSDVQPILTINAYQINNNMPFPGVWHIDKWNDFDSSPGTPYVSTFASWGDCSSGVPYLENATNGNFIVEGDSLNDISYGNFIRWPNLFVDINGDYRVPIIEFSQNDVAGVLSDSTIEIFNSNNGSQYDAILRHCWELDPGEWGYCEACTYPTDECTDCDGNVITEGDCANPPDWNGVGFRLRIMGTGGMGTGGDGTYAHNTSSVSSVDPFASCSGTSNCNTSIGSITGNSVHVGNGSGDGWLLGEGLGIELNVMGYNEDWTTYDE